MCMWMTSANAHGLEMGGELVTLRRELDDAIPLPPALFLHGAQPLPTLPLRTLPGHVRACGSNGREFRTLGPLHDLKPRKILGFK